MKNWRPKDMCPTYTLSDRKANMLLGNIQYCFYIDLRYSASQCNMCVKLLWLECRYTVHCKSLVTGHLLIPCESRQSLGNCRRRQKLVCWKIHRQVPKNVRCIKPPIPATTSINKHISHQTCGYVFLGNRCEPGLNILKKFSTARRSCWSWRSWRGGRLPMKIWRSFRIGPSVSKSKGF